VSAEIESAYPDDDSVWSDIKVLQEYRRIGVAMDVPKIIIRIHATKAWLRVGYDNWDDLCLEQLGGWVPNLEIEDRREVVSELTEAGLSTRAIGSALGVDDRTVRRDQGAANAAPVPVQGLDGKTYQPRPTREVTTSETVTVDAETGEIVPPAPSKPHRRPLPDAMRDASHELLKSAQRLERLTSDDRWPRNAKQATAMTRGDLLQAIEALTTVLDRLDQSASAA